MAEVQGVTAQQRVGILFLASSRPCDSVKMRGIGPLSVGGGDYGMQLPCHPTA